MKDFPAASPPTEGNRPLYLQRYAIPAAFIHKYEWISQDCQIFEEINSTEEEQQKQVA